jgi:hypothetical protein
MGLSVASRSFCPLVAILFAAGISGAAELPHGKDVPVQPNVEIYLRGRVALWQDRLKLQDWSVSLVVSSPSDLRPGTLGNIHWDPDKKTAVIRVLAAPDNQTPPSATLTEMEETIVHELVHLELASLPKTDAGRSDEEFAVIHLTEALLWLDRQSLTANTTR